MNTCEAILRLGQIADDRRNFCMRTTYAYKSILPKKRVILLSSLNTCYSVLTLPTRYPIHHKQAIVPEMQKVHMHKPHSILYPTFTNPTLMVHVSETDWNHMYGFAELSWDPRSEQLKLFGCAHNFC